MAQTPHSAPTIVAMLSTLRIKNLALVADLTLDLRPGYTAITGETGAGKSILIGALNLLLGERADRTLLRTGADQCSVEAIFLVDSLGAPLAEYLAGNGIDPCQEGQLLLKRILTSAGTNRQFVNGSPTSLATLAHIGQWLVDVHGPHDHQSLLQPAIQLELLDAFADLGAARDAFAAHARRRQEIAAERNAWIGDEQSHRQQLDLLRFQADEIQAARLSPDEEPRLEQEHRLASNAARLAELSQTALQQIDAEEAGLATQLGALGRTLQELKRLDPESRCLVSLHEEAASFLRDLRSDLSHYTDKLDPDPARLRQLEERLDLIHSLKRKYGGTVEEILARGEDAAARLGRLEARDQELARLEKEAARVDADLLRLGRDLSARRRKAFPALARAVARELADLGFVKARFDIALTSRDTLGDPGDRLGTAGLDTVEFQFAPNPGEPALPLRAIASSGEMARVMLALKRVLADQDQVPVLVFDEVDANIGGNTAAAVGEKMRQIGRHHQVLCITHLAPVAACARTHLVVTKDSSPGRTLTTVRELDRAERVPELARMLGGPSDAARRHAEALLREAVA